MNPYNPNTHPASYKWWNDNQKKISGINAKDFLKKLDETPSFWPKPRLYTDTNRTIIYLTSEYTREKNIITEHTGLFKAWVQRPTYHNAGLQHGLQHYIETCAFIELVDGELITVPATRLKGFKKD